MAGIGPYGIEQVDVPGVVNSAQNIQMNRIRMIMAQKQLEMMTGTQKALQAYAAGEGGSSSPTSDFTTPAASAAPNSSTPGTMGGSVAGSTAATTTPVPSSGMPPPQPTSAQPSPAIAYTQPVAPSADELARRQALFHSVVSFNPEMAGQLADAFTKMDADTLNATVQRHTRIAQVAAGILQLPPAQRTAALQQEAPELQALGVPPQKIAGFNPTDENLRQLVAEGMDIERIAQFSRPEVQSVRQGGALVSTNPDGTPKTLYESPTMVGPNGEVFERPSALSTMPHPQTATNPKTGERVQFNPQTNQWEPIGGQTPPASGGFQ
jgi:hypothetical protein